LGKIGVAGRSNFAEIVTVMFGSNTPPTKPQRGVSPGLLPLTRVRAGTTARIRVLAAQPEAACRLRELGLCEGYCVTPLTSGETTICRVQSARLALSRRLAESVLVEGVAERGIQGSLRVWWNRMVSAGRAVVRWGRDSQP
jgi:Fe2+ transport system protein FeoA